MRALLLYRLLLRATPVSYYLSILMLAKDLSIETVGLFVAFWSAGSIITALPVSVLADRLGGKSFLIAGQAVRVIAFALVLAVVEGLLDPFTGFALSLFLTGVAQGVLNGVYEGYYFRSWTQCTPSGRSNDMNGWKTWFGWSKAMNYGGAVLGCALGLALFDLGWVWLSAGSLVAVSFGLLVSFFVPRVRRVEPGTPNAEQPSIAKSALQAGEIFLASKGFLAWLIAISVVVASRPALDNYWPILIEEVVGSARPVVVFVTFGFAAQVLGSLLETRIGVANGPGPGRTAASIAVASWAIPIVCLVLFTLTTVELSMITVLSALLFMLGQAMLVVRFEGRYIEISPDENKSSFFAAYAVLRDLGVALLALLFGIVGGSYGYPAGFAAISVLAGFAAVLALLNGNVRPELQKRAFQKS